jgi:hypothetical protein
MQPNLKLKDFKRRAGIFPAPWQIESGRSG